MVERRRLPRTNAPREVQGWRREQDDDNARKANKVPNADEDNIIIFDDEGDLKDSGVGIEEIALKTGSTRRAYFYGRHF